MGKAEIGSMEDYVRLHPDRAGGELAAGERALAEIRGIVVATIYTTPSEALRGMAKILRIIDGQPDKKEICGVLNEPPASRRTTLTAWFTGFLASYDGHPKGAQFLADDVLDLLDDLT